MIEKPLSREAAWTLLTDYTKSPALIQHALQVEAAMRHFARRYDGDPDVWGVCGLIHDLDYDQYPDEHCHKAAAIMTEEGIDPFYIHAMLSHGYGICTDTAPESDLEKVLYTIDELTGLINAACLMRPSKSVLDLELKSLKKKFKDKRFAAGVNRDIVRNGAELLDLPLDTVMEETIAGMQEAAETIGLKGNL